jgi:DNA-binding response OmpR family regulator
MEKMINSKVYIIEDEALVATSLEEIVKQAGYTTLGYAINYDDAIKDIKELKPDILLVDIKLNNSKSGIELVKDIKPFLNPKVIFITSYSNKKIIEEAFETEPINYIIKPYKQEDIEVALFGAHRDILKNRVNEYRAIKLTDNAFYYPEKKVVIVDKESINLGIKENSLLSILVESRGYIVETQKLEYLIWSKSIRFGTLRNLVYNLRKKLPFIEIQSINNGYRLI